MSKRIMNAQQHQQNSTPVKDFGEPINTSSNSKKTFDLSSKKFFTDIKAELKNIRTDVNKLAQKPHSNSHEKEAQEKNMEKVEANEEIEINIHEQQLKVQKQRRSRIEEEKLKWKQEREDYEERMAQGKEEVQKYKKIEQFFKQKQQYHLTKINELKESIKQKDDKIVSLKDLLTREKEKCQKLQQQFKNQTPEQNESLKFRQLGSSFQQRINELLNENHQLKNKVFALQGQREEQQFKLKSFQATIQVFEERQKQASEGALQQQLIQLRKKVIFLQEQKDKIQSDYEYEIMKLENQVDEVKNGNNTTNEASSLNQIIKDQLKQIEYLRGKLKQKK